MAFPPMWCRAKRSRLLSWTTPGESQRLFVWPADLDVFGFGFDKVMFDSFFFLMGSARRWISSMKANMLKDDLFYCYLFSIHVIQIQVEWETPMDFEVMVKQLNTCFWMMCFLGPFTKIGERTLAKLRQVSLMGWQVKRLARQLDLTLIIIHVPGPWWVPDPMFYFGKNSEIFFFQSQHATSPNCEENLFSFPIYNNISPRRRLCFPPKKCELRT